MHMADASGKAALARTRSKTCRFFGDGSAREASWTAECQFRFGRETGITAIGEFCLTPPWPAFRKKRLLAGARASKVRAVSVQLTILGSGSGGNCAYLETAETRLLIDAGFSGRQIRRRLAGIARAPEGLDGILITHEHSDHIAGLAALAVKLQLPVYCNRLTKEAIEAQLQIQINARLFTTGGSFEVGDVTIDTFSVPHDAYDPVGFLLRTCSGNIGFLTDLGHATKLVVERVRCANVLVLEANHDLKMLQDDVRRPWSLKQRILSRHGHLSNEGAAEVVEQIISADLRRLYLGHLSRDCNHPALARQVVGQRLERIGGTHVCVESTSQDSPCPTLAL
ncbi:MAG TPA: MBL fold metallo-hydrolase [Candidatus Saccharimonadales bacterium]|nr:MBL fold metallo-hydrolase [Candidatus Saccharimonadales bacterium]